MLFAFLFFSALHEFCLSSVSSVHCLYSERKKKILPGHSNAIFKWVLCNGVFIHESFVKRFFFMSCLACSQRECSFLSFTLIKLF